VTPDDFIHKWKASTLSERSAAHSHFLDLCALLGEATPTDSDQTGDSYTFEKGATKTTGGKGWADVWKRGYFAWEYKGKHKSLTAAFAQLQQYTPVLENPPLLVVSDMEAIEVHTNWTATVPVVHRLSIDDLRDAETRALLKAVFSNPETLKPGRTRQALTEDVARDFAQLAMRLQGRGHDPQEVAHFVNRLVFCMFAEDVDLLPNNLFKRMLMQAASRPEMFASMARQLFSAMRTGGSVGFESVMWFNGGLFDTDDALPLDKEDVKQVLAAAEQDWGQIDPSILGTLFERGLDPGKRGQLGAHYTDAPTIMRLINPVIVDPLTREWEDVRRDTQAILDKVQTSAARTRARREAERLCVGFLERLRKFRVLDPACGSGNFLYLALRALKELEHRVNLDCEVMGFTRQFPSVGPEAVHGIEVNPYAAELARVSVWIGEIQWMRRNGFAVSPSPILKPLDTIACRDAVLNADGTEAAWPTVDAIIGNPPFLGDKSMNNVLGERYTSKLRSTYLGRVPGGADLVCYWFEKARSQLTEGNAKTAGLVSTNSIRGGANRIVLDRIQNSGSIFEAWSDEPWILEGAAVRVSLVCFSKEAALPDARLNGAPVAGIFADLSAGSANLTKARPLVENGRPNSDVLKPWVNGQSLTERWQDTWIIDFAEMSEAEASLYEAPFAHVLEHVKPARMRVDRERRRRLWWQYNEPAPGLRRALATLPRYIATPEVAKYRLFVWYDRTIAADKNLVVFARDDDTAFGILHSRFHAAWALRLGSSLENRPRYTSSTTFRTFPFPTGLTPNIPAMQYAGDERAKKIAISARRLDELRNNWLNPSDLISHHPEVVPSYPDRIIAINAAATETLKTRTLTNLYNKRPAWLPNVHGALDEAVAAAYGWPADISDESALARLLALNLERSGDDIPISKT